jgi:sarcosine oxidase subunit gamma
MSSGEPNAHVDAALGFEDLSRRPRCGCKGPGAQAWLKAAGYNVPAAPNSVVVDDDGVLVARLATSEFLLEGVAGGFDRIGSTLKHLASAERPSDVYPVARFDRVIGIEGRATNTLLRQFCSVDFASLLVSGAPNAGPVVLTSMIGVNVVAWPRCLDSVPSVTVWIDPSFAYYFWTTLMEVGREIGGLTIRGSATGGDNQ